VEVGEAYTSKTCVVCGNIHHDLGSNEMFECPACGHVAARDLQAAKNVLLRYLTIEGLLNL
jgi:putative transposase